jgi:poly(A) polymerase
VRFMGDARARIAEDYLRVLRLFRFHAWYGKGEIDAEGLRAAALAKDKLKSLSAERIAKELLRLLEAAHPVPVLRVMAATGILSLLLPGALQLVRLEKLAQLEAENPGDAVLRLAALLPDGASAAQTAADALRVSNAVRDRLANALGGEKSGRKSPHPKRGGFSIGSARQASRTRSCCNGRARRKARPAPGGCCWKWRTVGSGRASS